VGVSRQAIAAIEAGRQVPSTQLALQLARTLGCVVEDLFSLPSAETVTAVLAADAPHPRLALAQVDGVWVAHPVHDCSPGDALLRGLTDTDHPMSHTRSGAVSVEPLTGLDQLATHVLIAGCAPLLGLLTARLGRHRRDARATWIG